jgi:PleD family two-component response regulator
LAISHAVVPSGRLTISVGLCHSSELGATTPEAMLGAADNALYQAKARGRDQVVDAQVLAVAV